jgi:hypothetical protein
MSTVTADITFNMDDPNKTVIKTDLTKEGLEEVLSEFVHAEIGEGKDDSKPNEYGVYSIKIRLDLSDDSFHVESDTGNKGLTLGIIMDVLKRLDAIAIEPI